MIDEDTMPPLKPEDEEKEMERLIAWLSKFPLEKG